MCERVAVAEAVIGTPASERAAGPPRDAHPAIGDTDA